jgi:hypothetical protein
LISEKETSAANAVDNKQPRMTATEQNNFDFMFVPPKTLYYRYARELSRAVSLTA